MSFEDPSSWAQGASAFKSIFDGLRSAIGLVKELGGSTKNDPSRQRLLDEALDQASTAAKLAEAQLAKALGYELCKCEFPPIPMNTVGRMDRLGKIGEIKPVYECPKCGYNTAGGWAYTRIAPPRAA